MNEIWKPVPGFEGLYMISSLGRLKSLDRLVVGEKRSFKKSGTILKPSIDARGYLYFKFRPFGKKRNERINIRIHRLVALVFIGKSENQIDHKNRIKTDNRVENLRYVTSRENSIAANARPEDQMYITKVSAYKNRHERYQAIISVNGKKVFLGSSVCLNKVKKLRDQYIEKNSINTKVERNG